MKSISVIKKPKTKNVAADSHSLNTNKRESTQLVDLNFKVSSEFHREFKIYAAANDMTMKEVMLAAFDALKEKLNR